jgi:hypothetical protein
MREKEWIYYGANRQWLLDYVLYNIGVSWCISKSFMEFIIITTIKINNLKTDLDFVYSFIDHK